MYLPHSTGPLHPAARRSHKPCVSVCYTDRIMGIPVDYAAVPTVRRRRRMLRIDLLLLCLVSGAVPLLIIRHISKPPPVPPPVAWSPFVLQTRKMIFDGPWYPKFQPDSPDLDPSQRNGGWKNGGRWPPVILPTGIQNVALKRPVTASTVPVNGAPAWITDEKIDETHDDECLDLGQGLQWVQIDLQARYTIYAIVLWRPVVEGHPYRDVIVQLSDDPLFQRGVTPDDTTSPWPRIACLPEASCAKSRGVGAEPHANRPRRLSIGNSEGPNSMLDVLCSMFDVRLLSPLLPDLAPSAVIVRIPHPPPALRTPLRRSPQIIPAFNAQSLFVPQSPPPTKPNRAEQLKRTPEKTEKPPPLTPGVLFTHESPPDGQRCDHHRRDAHRKPRRPNQSGNQRVAQHLTTPLRFRSSYRVAAMLFRVRVLVISRRHD